MNIGRLPETGATTRENISRTAKQREAWITKNYEGVVQVGVGPGWGVTTTTDRFGDVSYVRDEDFMIEATLTGKASCPDPERGSLLVFDDDKNRVPVRFVYRSSSG